VDIDWALKEISECREVLSKISSLVNRGANDPFMYAVSPGSQMGHLKQKFLHHDVAMRVIATEAEISSAWIQANSVSRRLELLVTIESRLTRAEEIQKAMGPAGPKLAARSLHRWVWDAAASFWDQGEHDLAVREAARALDLHLQARMDRRDVSGVSLFQQAFSVAGAEEGKPRLRLTVEDVNDQTWKDLHAGAARLGEGAMLAFRNASIHDDLDLDEDQALEQLATLSLLARWIEAAVVVKLGLDAGLDAPYRIEP
jgi:hypothetical protein